ncbi:hypothetical protein HDV06_003965 [Boothiomyces sp. JEL0866]|nr:hypothetical protein HDV06_003965 [Boothiomyces sp. JEL0866]
MNRSSQLLRRAFSTPAKQWPSYEQTMLPKHYKERHHAVGTTRMWLYFNIFITAPVLVATIAFAIPPEMKHIEHLKHHPNEWVGFAYLRKRTRDTLPWGGSNSLFHNQYSNAVPPSDE